jgi:hypothetical protein
MEDRLVGRIASMGDMRRSRPTPTILVENPEREKILIVRRRHIREDDVKVDPK